MLILHAYAESQPATSRPTSKHNRSAFLPSLETGLSSQTSEQVSPPVNGPTSPQCLAPTSTDLVFTCTTSSLATCLALNGYSTYRYRYDAVFPSIGTFSNAGAYHTAEIPEVFGTYPVSNQFGTATQQQIDISAFMQKTWANFAMNPAAGVGWPKVPSLGNKLGVFGYKGSSGVTVRSKLESDYACPIYAPIEDLLGLSYR